MGGTLTKDGLKKVAKSSFSIPLYPLLKKHTFYFICNRTLSPFLWQNYPALFLGIALLCGSSLAFDFRLPFLIPLVSLCLLTRGKGATLLLLAAVSLGFSMGHLRYSFPQGGKEWRGQGLFVIQNIQKSASPFQQYWQCDGTFKWFQSESSYRNVPCSIFLPLKTVPPAPNQSYLLEGVIKSKSTHQFSFKPTKGTAWTCVKRRFSFAKWRFVAKETIRNYLHKHLKHPSSRDFLSALATGEMENRILKHNFASLGLQHLLAISGFHFGLIALSLSGILRLFLTPRNSALLLLPLITLYFFFIGPAPSCFRAWMTISLFLLSHIFSWRTSSLNLLGVSLITALLIDPLTISHLGFQLSYLITLSILLFYPLFEILFSPLLPPRPFQSLLKMRPLHQHGYLLSALIRSAIALNCAVHLLALPTLLFLFGKFPLLSLLYNLFFPFWVGISLFFLLLALILSPVSFLSAGIHFVNSTYTSWILSLTSHPPIFFHFFLRLNTFPLWILMTYLTLSFWGGLLLKEHFAAEKLTESPF